MRAKILLISIALIFTAFYAVAQTYHPDDKEGLRAFLRQSSGITGITNGERLGLQINDTLTWKNSEEWVSKVTALEWNNESPKRLTGIVSNPGYPYSGWNNKNFFGDLNCNKWTALTRLHCAYNQIKNIDISHCTNLKELHCYHNQLTTLDVSNNTALTVLHCHVNQLTILNISNNTNLTELACHYNGLATLDVSNNKNLTELHCYYNQLTTLDLSNNTDLTELRCSNNLLTALDVNNNINLTRLLCDNNQLLFSALLIQTKPMTYSYSPQRKTVGKDTYYQLGIDLSKEYNINGNITQFSWFDISEGTEQPVTLQGENGKFLLTEEFAGKRLRCKMTNATFPMLSGGSSLVYEVNITETTNIKENRTLNENVNIYPNPVATQLHIELGTQEKVSYNIFNATGQTLMQGQLQGTSIINVQSLVNGIYYLKIFGKESKTMKFVKY